MADEKPQIHIDSDWKAQAKQEKERLAAQSEGGGETAKAESGEKKGGGEAKRGSGKLPPADFQTLVTTLVTQAAMSMGLIPDPQSGRPMLHLELARHHIDMLGVVEEKTKGNLTEDEKKLLSTALYELRMQYVQISQAVVEQGIAGAGRGS